MECHHTFTFDDVHKARRFVERLCLTFMDIAIRVEGTIVYVWGDGTEGRVSELVRLSKESGAIALVLVEDGSGRR